MYKIFLFINIFHRKGLQSKLSPVGEDTNRGSSPWAVSPPPTISLANILFPNIFQNRKDAIGSHFIKQQLELL